MVEQFDITNFTTPVNEQSFECFLSHLNNLFECCFPLTKISIKQYKNKPWITSPILSLINKKNKLFRDYIKQQSPELLLEYKCYKRLTQKLLKSEENKYYSQKLASDSKNMKKIWTLLNSLLKPNSCHQNIILKDPHSLSVISDPHRVASLFNSFFLI